MRKENSKVNTLKRENEELQRQVDYHANVTASCIMWLKRNCTKEQRAEFKEHLVELTNRLANANS